MCYVCILDWILLPKVQTPGSVFHSEDSYLDDVFFDTPVPTSAAIVSDVQPRLVPRFNETDGFHATDSVRATDGSAADRLSAPSEKSGIYYDLPAPGSDRFLSIVRFKHITSSLSVVWFSPTISLGSHQNIGLHTGTHANVVLLT